MRRCGAALVLAELAPKTVDVVKALGEALDGANEPLAGCILEALEAIGSRAAVPYVMPMLNAEDISTRLRAAAVISCAGAAVVPEIKRQIGEASRRQKLVLVDLLARIHSTDALRILLDELFDHDFELVKQTCEAVRRHLGDAKPTERLKLHEQVAEFMRSTRVKERERVFASCLLLVGNIGRPEARSILLKHTGAKSSPYIRRNALVALRGLTHTSTTAAALLRKVLPYLDEDDSDIVRQVVEIIERLPASVLATTQLRGLLKSKHGAVRALAARRLAETDTAPGNRLLVDLLGHDDSGVQEIAASALSRHEKATPSLLEALAVEKDLDAAWRLARILKPHGEAVTKTSLKKFVTKTAIAMLAADPLHEPLLYLVRNVDPAAAEALVLDTGMKHKRAKRWAEAVNCLRRLIHTDTFDSKVSYALSVCDLKLSPKELAPQFRADCHALRGLRSLRRTGALNLLDQLTKDKTLDASDLYYVGFHFREGTGDDVAFGEDLLRHIAATWPKSKEAKAVKGMLKLTRPRKKATRTTKKAAGKR